MEAGTGKNHAVKRTRAGLAVFLSAPTGGNAGVSGVHVPFFDFAGRVSGSSTTCAGLRDLAGRGIGQLYLGLGATAGSRASCHGRGARYSRTRYEEQYPHKAYRVLHFKQFPFHSVLE